MRLSLSAPISKEPFGPTVECVSAIPSAFAQNKTKSVSSRAEKIIGFPFSSAQKFIDIYFCLQLQHIEPYFTFFLKYNLEIYFFFFKVTRVIYKILVKRREKMEKKICVKSLLSRYSNEQILRAILNFYRCLIDEDNCPGTDQKKDLRQKKSLGSVVQDLQSNKPIETSDHPPCGDCGGTFFLRTGTCHVCQTCGASQGCS